MAENEIPLDGTFAIQQDVWYRVSVLSIQSNHPSLPQAEIADFRSGNMWDRKENALRFFTCALEKQSRFQNIKLVFSLMKIGMEDREETFVLIGGTDEEMHDARMEEEIAFAMQRTHGHF